jgi:drug/metabolite transporter (DMT)-like permease
VSTAIDERASGERLGVLFALLAATGFSAKAVLVKLGYQHAVSPVSLLSLRMLFAAPIFVVVARRSAQQARALTRAEWVRVGALGLLGYYGASLLDFLGLQYISPGLERLILFTYPTLTLLAQAATERRRLTRPEVVALVLTYAGVGLAFAHDLEQGGELRSVLIGGALVFGSSVSFTFYLAGSGRVIAAVGSARFTALAMLVSTLATVLHFGATEPLSSLVLPWPVYGIAAAMAMVSTALPVFLQSAAIERLGAGRAALIGTIGPMLTIALGWAVLGDRVSPAQLAGAALVVAGVFQVSRPRAAHPEGLKRGAA